MAEKIFDWLDERLGLKTIYDTVLDRKVPRVNWWFTLGSASLFIGVMQGITGIFLTMYYVPSPDKAYDSIQYIMNGVAFGWLIRGIHHWGASLLVVVLFIHMLRTFFYGAYKYPREMTWLTGTFLFLLTLGMGFTGYLLPWNQRAYWATTVGTEIGGVVPFIGDFILKVLRGGADISAVTLARFFSAHIWIFPAIIVSLVGIHMYLIIRLGISNIPGKDE
ncbi:MAG: cytochrome b N-terminal domain-containing protein [Chloroflexi bacterium]|nr:cytochrome b N-terminal domain-containing protein [Chloroflexota bacterium]MBU1661152.1 cytochrome b N-terminal domain-containing protein [Chloroflexota bacterium]